MNIWVSLILILIMTLASKFLRTLAFGRSDSIALEVAICSFLHNLLYAVGISDSVDQFLQNELMRCIVLLLFAFVIAATHHYYKELNMSKIESLASRIQLMLNHKEKESGSSHSRHLEHVMVDEIGMLARQSIDVWYSQFVDRLGNRFLKQDEGVEGRSFRKKKSIVRWGFADLLNSLSVADQYEKPLDDKDFNIDNKSQITGMVIFDLMQILSLIVAVRLV